MVAKSDGPNGRERESQNQGETETERLGEAQREREWESSPRVSLASDLLKPFTPVFCFLSLSLPINSPSYLSQFG